jgi:dethiobiotin synthetase
LNRSIFITGTDTDIGKTTVSKIILEKLSKAQKSTAYYKPVQSGGAGDTLSVSELGVSVINSYTMEKPYSPHLASELEGIEIKREKLLDDYREAIKKSDYTVVEGAGGVVVPIIRGEYYAWQMIQDMGIPALIVAELRVGGINHTLLSFEFLKSKGIEVRAIFANRYGGSEFERDNKKVIEDYTGLEVITEFKEVRDVEQLFAE